jgi:hypothetical protein
MSETFKLRGYRIDSTGDEFTFDDETVAIIRRSAMAKAWDECAQEAHDLGWIYEMALTEMKSRNPWRGEQA